MKKYLMTPGPTPIPPEVLLKMAEPIIHHRTPQFMAILKEANEGLKYVFQTKNDVITFASSGTGAMEASVINVLSAGDKCIVVRGGKFGERFAEIAQAYGITPINIDVQWGTAPDPEIIKATLKKNPDVKAVYTTLCETSTGTTYDIESIGKIVKDTPAILVVDAISGLGADQLMTDEWAVDIVVAGSQKGLMLPPGLSFCSVSQKAMGLAEKSKAPKFYFSFKAAKKALDKTDTPWTPAITLIIGLTQAIKLMREEGLDNIFKRHHKLAEATRQGVKAIALELYSKRPSDAITAIKVPAGVDGEKLVKSMRDTHGVTIAGGQEELKGKIFRIAHMGFMEKFDVVAALTATEIGLAEQGYKFEYGKSQGAAEKVLLD